MANTKVQNENYEQVLVDTQPASGDGFTNSMNMKTKPGNKFWLVISGTGTMAVTLQYKEPNNGTWTDYEDLTANGIKVYNISADLEWRAGVKDSVAVDAARRITLLWETV
jgi:hypothetical protein